MTVWIPSPWTTVLEAARFLEEEGETDGFIAWSSEEMRRR